MGAFEKLVVEGKNACVALEQATPWKRHAWAKAIRGLERAGLLPHVGLSQVLAITGQTGLDPESVVDLIVAEAAKVVEAERQRQLAEHPLLRNEQ